MKPMKAAGRDDARAEVDLMELLADLRAESDALDSLVTGLDENAWRRETPAPGWTIAQQVSHLAWTDAKALLAVTDDEGFQAEIEKAAADIDAYVEKGAERGAHESPVTLLERWRRGRHELAEVLAAKPKGSRIPWYGPSMSVASMVTARLMETWAHGQDILDALGTTRNPTARLRHIARLGVRTRDFAYRVRGLQPPEEEFFVELTGPQQQVWNWGPAQAAQRVTGTALDFCLVVTQRRHVSDTALHADGAEAQQWLRIAQAFAGPPGSGRTPGQFA